MYHRTESYQMDHCKDGDGTMYRKRSHATIVRLLAGLSGFAVDRGFEQQNVTPEQQTALLRQLALVICILHDARSCRKHPYPTQIGRKLDILTLLQSIPYIFPLNPHCCTKDFPNMVQPQPQRPQKKKTSSTIRTQQQASHLEHYLDLVANALQTQKPAVHLYFLNNGRQPQQIKPPTH